jgi:uncharacterized membrane protein
MESALSQHRRTADDKGDWLAGLIVVVATIVAFMGFALASLKWTLIVSSVVLVFLIMFLWLVGVRKQRARGQSDTRR